MTTEQIITFMEQGVNNDTALLECVKAMSGTIDAMTERINLLETLCLTLSGRVQEQEKRIMNLETKGK
jgi:hypothetical protein